MKTLFLFIPFAFYFGAGNQLSGTKWNLYSVQNDKENFKFVLIKVNSTIEFGDSICNGKAGCNDLIGPYLIEKETISFDLSTTLRNCSGNEEIVESFVTKNLRKLFYKIDTDTLVLFNREGVMLKYIKKK